MKQQVVNPIETKLSRKKLLFKIQNILNDKMCNRNKLMFIEAYIKYNFKLNDRDYNKALPWVENN